MGTFNDLPRACPHHGFFELHQLDTFYNALNFNDPDSLNSATGGNFLDKMPRECLKIIESKSKVRQSRAKAVVAKPQQITIKETPVSDLGYFETKMAENQNELKNMMSSFLQMQQPSGSGSLPSNTITKLRGDVKTITTRSGIAYDGTTIPSTPSPFLKLRGCSLHMPKFAFMFKSLLSNKEKLFELASTPVNENCSAVLLKKLPEKLGDPCKFSDSSTSGNPTPSDPIIASSSPLLAPFKGSDFILEEIETFLRTSDELSTLDDDFDLQGYIAFIEKWLNEDPSLNLPLIKNEDLKQVDATMTKSSI
nr:reverse transcriptase domain-containing protein [Tanacetum cinerariifolium]